jgi:hypothetical protein
MTKGLVFKALLTAFSLCLLAVASTPITVSAEQTGPCDTSGAYTDRLCVGEHLAPSEYLLSPNGRYRLYYQADGAAIIYDTDDFEEWVNVCQLANSFPDPGKFQYSGFTAFGMADPVYWRAFDDYNFVYQGSGISLDPDGDHALTLSNSGTLEVWDESGFLTDTQINSCL